MSLVGSHLLDSKAEPPATDQAFTLWAFKGQTIRILPQSFVCLVGNACVVVCVEVRGQCLGVTSLLQLCHFWELNSDWQAWQQALASVGLTPQPLAWQFFHLGSWLFSLQAAIQNLTKDTQHPCPGVSGYSADCVRVTVVKETGNKVGH